MLTYPNTWISYYLKDSAWRASWNRFPWPSSCFQAIHQQLHANGENSSLLFQSNNSLRVCTRPNISHIAKHFSWDQSVDDPLMRHVQKHHHVYVSIKNIIKCYCDSYLVKINQDSQEFRACCRVTLPCFAPLKTVWRQTGMNQTAEKPEAKLYWTVRSTQLTFNNY